MPEVKGVLIMGRLAFMKNTFGEKTLDLALAGLSREDRTALATPFLPSTWYPLEMLRVLDRLTRLCPESGQSTSTEIGRALAEYVCTGVYKSMVAPDPIKQVGRISWVGDMLYRNYRHCESKLTGKSSCVVTYIYDKGVAPTPGMCKSTTGFLVRLMELSGATHVTGIHDKCVGEGADRCEFRLSWI
ncbi:MAG TPA: hypothetical protein VI756_23795 [Blastocatellia bacterium]